MRSQETHGFLRSLCLLVSNTGKYPISPTPILTIYINLPMENRIILHIDMDCFFAAIEERENPHFKGKPVVVGADPKEGSGRGVVSTANYEARTYGIHSAMPISQAYRLCPKAVFLPVNGELYAQTSLRIMEIVHAVCYDCPVEQVSLDEAYIDITASVKNSNTSEYWSSAQKAAEKLQQEIWSKEKLACTIGIGPNKMIAKIACEKAKPNGILIVNPREVQDFLDPLPIKEIPGVGPKTNSSLARLSCKQLSLAKEPCVKDVKKVSRAELREILGKHGETLYGKVRGVDESPVVMGEEVKSLGKEHTFEYDTRDGEEIFSVFRELVSQVVLELKKEGFSFKTITVVCRFQGFETHTKSKTLKVASEDWKLLEKEAMRLLLKFLTENLKPVRLIGIRTRVAQGLGA